MTTRSEAVERGKVILTVDMFHEAIDKITYPDKDVNPDYIEGSDDFEVFVENGTTGEVSVIEQVRVTEGKLTLVINGAADKPLE